MNTSDIILLTVSIIAFIPFVILILGGTVVLINDMLKEIVDKWKPKNNTDTNTEKYTK